jgi:cytochrome c oxidase subunit 2
VLPVDTKIRFVLTADDVIHAWWVPALGWKQDAIPGIVNEAWTEIQEPGIYRGQCAELCGKDHGFMPIVVKAVPQGRVRQWLAAEEGQARPGGEPAPRRRSEAAPRRRRRRDRCRPGRGPTAPQTEQPAADAAAAAG